MTERRLTILGYVAWTVAFIELFVLIFLPAIRLNLGI
jgi:hypothetical protein